MTREEQDKNWDNLSQECKEEMMAKYAEFSAKGTPESKGYCQGLANVFGKHNLQSTLTYEDVARELFGENNEKQKGTFCCPVFSENHCDKISSINSLICVAKFLNKNEDGSDWAPDWENADELKWYPIIRFNKIDADYAIKSGCSFICFRTGELIRQAVQILGEDVVRMALTTEY